MRKLKVVHVTNTFCADGTGITNVVADVAFTQASIGYTVTIACETADDELGALASKYDVQVAITNAPKTVIGMWQRSRLLAPTLRSADVIHVHTVRATIAALLAQPLRFRQISIATVHNPYQTTSMIMLCAKKVIALSHIDGIEMKRRVFARRDPIVIQNGVLGSPRLKPLSAVVPANILPDSVVFVGAVSERKGLDILLRSMVSVVAALPTAHLYIIGNRDNPDLEALSKDLGLVGNVTFVGYQADPRRFLLSAKVFVLPSRAEGFPLALLEARGCGAPIVATAAGGIPEALDYGEAGIIVDVANPETLATALISVMTDDSLRYQLRTASARGIERYSVEAVVKQYSAAYEGLAKSR